METFRKYYFPGTLIAVILAASLIGWHETRNPEVHADGALVAASGSEAAASSSAGAKSSAASSGASSGAKRSGGNGTPGLSKPDPSVAVVIYTDRGFQPFQIEVVQGATVRFVNMSSKGMWIAHNAAPTSSAEYTSFDQGKTVKQGGVYNFIFTRSGAFGYHNMNDEGDTGAVIVIPQ